FMNVFNVHVNRSPCDGEVTAVEHSPGRWLDVRRPDAWHMNESVLISLTCRIGDQQLPVVVRQVAGMVARRIVCRLSQGDRVRRGERIGMIKFGSRLELLLPDQFNAQVTVHVGQKVLAGATVLAKVGTSPIIDPTSGANDA
ncbi:MAG: phosphatidylserine decarboxylase, partial [Planctomycetes bacterium]|nr:phosphatidylserine decarboxylase [Planctomycetota bacterium]